MDLNRTGRLIGSLEFEDGDSTMKPRLDVVQAGILTASPTSC